MAPHPKILSVWLNSFPSSQFKVLNYKEKETTRKGDVAKHEKKVSAYQRGKEFNELTMKH